jgi:hypothetical protein
VRDVHQATLCPDPADDLGQRQHVGNPLGEEQPDHVAVRGPDLLADDHPHAQVALRRRDGRVRDVVVGHADGVQASLPRPVGELIHRQHGVSRRDGVQVAVHPHPSECHRAAPRNSASSSRE